MLTSLRLNILFRFQIISVPYNKKNLLSPHQVIHLILLICEAGTGGDIFSCSSLVLVCVGVLGGICDVCSNQCIGVPKHLMFSALVESKIHARK